ncbi:MAG: glycosyltransferase [Phycisphaerales bacterium]|nr:glycosyltransferase [Phycisphaerales bacterium]
MKIAYLINQYPKVSHSFVRREIAEIEARGMEVQRFSIQKTKDKIVDEADQVELAKTHALLAEGVLGLAKALFGELLCNPCHFFNALRTALRMGWRSDRGMPRHVAYLIEACLLKKRLRQIGADHIHAHFATNSTAVALLCHMLGGPGYSFTAHGMEAFDAPEFISLGEKVKRSAFTVAISEHGRSQICRWSPPEAWPKVQVVRCGVDHHFLDYPRTPLPASRRLVVVARLSPEKGHLVLMDAARRLAEEGLTFELVLVGDGPMRPQIETFIQHCGLEKCVKIAGWKSGADVRDEIIASQTMVLPSFTEGLPVVLMEALALGRPVISTYIAGIPELVENGVNGWLVPAGAVEPLADAMRQALKTPREQLERMGQAGRIRVHERHNAAREAARLAELFKQSITAAGKQENDNKQPMPLPQSI